MEQRAYARTATVTAAVIGLLATLTAVGVIGHARPPDVSAQAGMGAPRLSADPATPTAARPAPRRPDLLQPLDATADWPSEDGIAAAVAPYLDGLGARAGLAVAGDGRLLYGRNADTGFIPASTAKLLTGVAALATFGPNERFTTTVVRGPAEDEIVLIGGGDPLLTLDTPTAGYPERASLAALAERTAATLAGQGSVVVHYDASLFSGPTSARGWRASYLRPGTAAIGRVSALAVDGGRIGRLEDRVRAPDPAAAAAEQFAGLLNGYDLDVKLGRPVTATADVELATVSSPPVAAIVEVMLTESDNDIAEVLARHVALTRGEQPTFDGGARAIMDAIGEIGIDTAGLQLHDGSGLSRSNVITPRILVSALSVAVQRPELRGLLTGLPVAGFTGTLDDRSATLGSDARSAGLARAKTGTLLGVSALAGVVHDVDGRLLTFALLADRVTSPDDAVDALDAVAAALAGCGCS